MSIKSKLVTAATTLTVIAGVGAAGTGTANAATPKCGQECTDFYSHATGTGFVLEAAGRLGQPVTLAGASRASKHEDFGADPLGQVRDFYRAGLVSGGLTALYGSLPVYEIEYIPGDSTSDLCLGTASAPRAGTKVTLQPCGMTAATVWIFAPQPTGWVLISADTRNSFQHPYVLTAAKPGAPLVTTQSVASTASGFARQLWSALQGVLPH